MVADDNEVPPPTTERNHPETTTATRAMSQRQSCAHGERDSNIQASNQRIPGPGLITEGNHSDMTGFHTNSARTIPVVEICEYDGCDDGQQYEGAGVVATVAAEPVPVQQSGTSEREVAISSPIVGPPDSGSQRPGLVHVCAFKPTTTDKLGIMFANQGDGLRVGSLTPSRCLSESPLQVGDRIISINGLQCQSLQSEQAFGVVRSLEGYISVGVHVPNGNGDHTLFWVFKSRPTDRLGIYFTSSNGKLQISKVNKRGILGREKCIRGGEFVLEINGIPCSDTDAHTAQMLVSNAPRVVELLLSSKHSATAFISQRNVAVLSPNGSDRCVPQAAASANVAPDETQQEGTQSHGWQGRSPMYISATVFKPSQSARLGIQFQVVNGNLQVSHINPGGMLGASPLRAGQRIISINNEQCTHWSSSRAIHRLKTAIGHLHIVALDQNGDTACVRAMAIKRNPESKIGIVFQSRGGRLEIGNIKPDSMFAHSVLNTGDSVLAINTTPASNMTVSEACDIIKGATNCVSILSETQATTGVVLAGD